LALTVLSSNVQRHVPPLPAARANPVMLLTAIARTPFSPPAIRSPSAPDHAEAAAAGRANSAFAFGLDEFGASPAFGSS
jgi:hypothetical protein